MELVKLRTVKIVSMYNNNTQSDYNACSLGISYPSLKYKTNRDNDNASDHRSLRSYIGGYAVSNLQNYDVLKLQLM